MLIKGGGGGYTKICMPHINFLLHSFVVALRTMRKTDITFDLTMPLF